MFFTLRDVLLKKRVRQLVGLACGSISCICIPKCSIPFLRIRCATFDEREGISALRSEAGVHLALTLFSGNSRD